MHGALHAGLDGPRAPGHGRGPEAGVARRARGQAAGRGGVCWSRCERARLGDRPPGQCGTGRGGPAGDVGRGLVSRAAPVTTPRPPQLVRYSAEGLLQLGPLGSTTFLPDSKCLVDDGRARTPALKKCEDVSRPAQRLWDFAQVSGDPAGPWGADGSGGPA